MNTAVLDDVLIESRLLGTALCQSSRSVDAVDHSLDEVPLIRLPATEVPCFSDKQQELYRLLPLCLWPFTKVSEIISESKGQTAVMKLLHVRLIDREWINSKRSNR